MMPKFHGYIIKLMQEGTKGGLTAITTLDTLVTIVLEFLEDGVKHASGVRRLEHFTSSSHFTHMVSFVCPQGI